MSEKLLFATDFDGTLNNYTTGISDYTKEMIRKFRAEGNYFGVITGRNYLGASWIWNDVHELCDFIMCMTGAYAMDTDGKRIFDSHGDGSILPGIIKMISAEKCRYLSWCDRENVYDISLDTPVTDESPEIIEAAKHTNFTQINTAFDSDEEVQAFLVKLKAQYGDKVTPHLNYTCVDIPPFGVSKGEAVGRMAEYYGVKPENIFTAGDNTNDISMLKAHYGFAITGKDPAVIAAAKESYDEVGNMLERVMEIRK